MCYHFGRKLKLKIKIKIMKKLIITLSLILLSKFVLGQENQFGIIIDKDGYVNLRKSPDISDNIIDKINANEIVFCFEKVNNWYYVYYESDKDSKSGYIHQSRIKLIKKIENILPQKITDSKVIFVKDSIKLILTKEKFNPINKKLKFRNVDSYKILEKVNNKDFFGTDGNVPQYEYGKITLLVKGKKIKLPCENLFEPNLYYTEVNINSKTKTIYIYAINSDGAGSYVVLWIVKDGIFKRKIVLIPF